MKKNALILLCLYSHLTIANDYSSQLVVSGLSVPWGMAFIDSNTLVVTERNGTIKRILLATLETTVLSSPENIYAQGQGGLLDIATSPKNPTQLFITYSKAAKNGARTTLATGYLNKSDVIHWRDLLVTDSASETSRHFGSRLTFDNNNALYFSIGDRGVRPNAQNRSNHAGSILRINLDGTIPTDNPFYSQSGIKSEIWSYGHRNPQGLFFDDESGQLWSIEHGPRGGDEINLIKKGQNYGWPITSHGKEYWGPVKVSDHKVMTGIEAPKLVYIPSIAPGSLILYRGSKYPKLNGKLLSGALKLTHINVIAIGKDGSIEESARLVQNLKQRIRDLELSPDGFIYFSTDQGNIYRLITKD